MTTKVSTRFQEFTSVTLISLGPQVIGEFVSNPLPGIHLCDGNVIVYNERELSVSNPLPGIHLCDLYLFMYTATEYLFQTRFQESTSVTGNGGSTLDFWAFQTRFQESTSVTLVIA